VVEVKWRSGYIIGLQSLRGVAALTVCIGHALQSYYVDSSYGSMVLNGRGAVVVFFVLSGYVLTLDRELPRIRSWRRERAALGCGSLRPAYGTARSPRQSACTERGEALIETETVLSEPNCFCRTSLHQTSQTRDVSVSHKPVWPSSRLLYAAKRALSFSGEFTRRSETT
jgi:hypothetical protein